MAIKYDLKEQERVYERWAAFYDRVYIRMLEPAQRRLAGWASAPGRRILEVGVGTGLVLRYYTPDTEVAAIDLSVPMLRKSVEKIGDLGLGHVAGVAAMDACRLGFADGTFDAVTVPFVITLVPDPEGALDEIARVLKPGGEIVIASRFGAEGGLQAAFENAIAPLVKKVGWSSSFKVSRVDAWAKARGDVDLTEVRRGLYFSVLRLVKRPAARA
jgi:phosphatidylethanolamine/phosphatidyl-N-methylethanolamine N-methyltransferase